MKELTSISLQGLNETSATAQYNLGDTYRDEKGNLHVYSQANEALSRFAILTVDEDALSVTVTSAGTGSAYYDGRKYDELAQITKTSGFGTAGTYEDYYGVVTQGGALGETFIVDKNSADGIYLKEPLAGVTTKAIKAFTPHIVIENPAGSPRVPVGIAPVQVVVSYYFWRQASGYARIIIDTATEGREGAAIFTGGGVAGQGRFGNEPLPLVGYLIVGSAASGVPCWVRLASML